MKKPTTATAAEWRSKRLELLTEEKELLRLQDAVAAKRRQLPWVPVEADYQFGTADGDVSLNDLFAGKQQLAVYHFMMGPDWEEGCPSCSFWADNFNGVQAHLLDRGVNLVAISRSPIKAIDSYKSRMGWEFPWVSSLGSTFNFDYGVSFLEDVSPDGEGGNANEYNYAPRGPGPDERQGLSAFVKDDDGQIYHTYSSYARGVEVINGGYHILDLMPLGRSEDSFEFPMQWVRRSDEYST